MIIIICGVSGSGKSSVGLQLSNELNWPFIEGDDFHSNGNIEKMRKGVPLTDDDRENWLDAIALCLSKFSIREQSVVASCSALKHKYRAQLRSGVSNIIFIQLDVKEKILRKRIIERKNHFAGINLLESQLMILEPLSADEGKTVSADREVKSIVSDIRKILNL